MPPFELPLGRLVVVESSASVPRAVTSCLLGCLGLAALLACAVWIVPLELAQAWAIDHAGNSDFEKFEAYGTATAAVWFLRLALIVATAGLALIWICRADALPLIVRAADEFWRVTNVTSETSPSKWSPVRTRFVQILLVGWLLLGVYHFGIGIARRLKDWPIYQLLAGPRILPNISDSNRDVIRYLAAATPPNSRILVLSDQKLYFLSYYLLPRRLYHPTHPDSEFVIAMPNNERQLAAYRLQDLTPEQIEKYRPDYVLEYFEGKSFTANENLTRDAVWMQYGSQRYGPGWQPSYLVSLRRYSAGDAR